MNKDDMMKLFGLKEKPKTEPGDPPKHLGETYANGTPRRSPNADTQPMAIANLDEWDVARGVELKEKHPDLHAVKAEDWADFHAAAYQLDPELDETCTQVAKQNFLTTLMETPDFQALRESTRLSTVASAVASEQFATEYNRMVESESSRKHDKDPMKEAAKAERASLKAAGRAVAAAAKEVEEMEETCKMLGIGSGAGNPGQPLDPSKVASVYNRVRNNALLRRICDLAGRYRRTAQAKQRQKVQHGYDDMVGVNLSGDVGRALPEELAKLAMPEFELDALRRLAERQLITREYRGVDKLARGPIVVCVDESGSMEGEPVCNAKAFALAMAWVARHQNRYCALIGYSGATQGNIITLPPRQWNEAALMDWLTHFYGCGTDMDVPLDRLPHDMWDRIGAPQGKTDLILITDAQCHVPPAMETTFLEWKKREKVKCYSLVIGYDAGDLRKVSDEVFTVNSINLQEEGIQACLGL